jgi:hypothetical protein
MMARATALNELNSLLQRLADANNGSDHSSEYMLYGLPEADSLQVALDRYFSGLSTSHTQALPPDRWGIHATAVTGWEETLRAVAIHWFYKLEYSPKVDPSLAAETVSEFVNRLRTLVGKAAVYEVHVTPPMWYDCEWQDFAFDGDHKRWLLHLGFSD